jgi:para-nitrobenzyl esterase
LASAVNEFSETLERLQPGQVWAYRFDWDEGATSMLADYSEVMGASHSLEIPFVMGQWQGLTFPGVFDENNAPGRETLSNQMISYWAAFADKGDPGLGREKSLPIWSSADASLDGVNTMRFDSEDGGGLSMFKNPLTVAEIKQRLRGDGDLSEGGQRCELYRALFEGQREWNAAELNDLGCD